LFRLPLLETTVKVVINETNKKSADKNFSP